jgi:hypothetical protein
MKRTFTPLARLAVLATMSLALGSSVLAGQPQMEAALQNLLAARAELQKANVSAGGARQSAIAAIDRAIAEVRAGKEYQTENRTGKTGKKKR